ncbi:GPO family capsid scaffolding protein [Pseudoalteromonas sp. S16_S37]|uniref:GPO family capsid scaffolding protein n=1 Tax=Pseudoalteromonas sp. S16_S37 TaxID=2720228 RepID=UPI0016805B68|nr:GPO family capsid scaffolding protein [Pseudoalteromonas sp. S16_S37]MBD1582790.1 phage capsid protein [Pseudoalteromonas sp. S16_S37]
MSGQLRTIPLAIAAVGLTVDGREITEKDINDIVETYSPKKYGARINIDHYADWSGWKAEALSSVKLNGGMLGDVIEVSTSKNEDGVQVLYAILAPNASFVLLNQADQHVYFSIERDRNFQGTGKTYLTGLAVTDYPASTYTSRAKFSRERGAENTDVSFLRADLGLFKEEEKPSKKPFFKTLFNKDDDIMPLTDQDKTDIGKAVADSLSPHFKTIADSMTAVAKNTEEEKGQQDEGQGGAQNTEQTELLNKLNEKFDKQSQEFKQLKDQFNELSKTEADDTTNADDEPTGDDGKYANLL